MSADNWAECPNCKKLAKERAPVYGEVPEAEYFAYLKKVVEAEDERNLREDYWQGINKSGEYEVSYHGECYECEFKFSYSYKVNVLENKDGK